MDSEVQKIPIATHQGVLNINGLKITCAVLEDGRRVVSERSVANSLGAAGSGGYWRNRKKLGAALPRYLYANFLEPFISDKVRELVSKPISYIAINKTVSTGIPAELLPMVCDIWIKAGQKGAVPQKSKEVSETAYVLLNGFATVGIIALVDEATGYQYEREIDELQTILKAYISEDILQWQLTFTNAFYKEVFKLWGIPFTPQNIKKKPIFVAGITNKFIYDKLPPMVMQKIRQRTPKTKGGNYKYRFHQSLTPEIGREHLKKQIIEVTLLMKMSDTKDDFKRLFEKQFGQTELVFEDLEIKELQKTEQPRVTPSILDEAVKKVLSAPRMPK